MSSTSNYQIVLQSPQTFRISMSESVQHSIGLTTPIPYGMAKLSIDTCANWVLRRDYIPLKGEIIIFSDRRSINGVIYPGIKIGDGKAYVVDLPFSGDDAYKIVVDLINGHINDTAVHLAPGERDTWNSKVSCRVSGESLILEGIDYNG